MNHDGAHILVNPVGVPKIIEDLAACKHPVRISGEKNQKFKFFCCKVYRFSSDCDGMSGKIDFQIAGRQNVLRRRGVGSTGVGHILSAEVCLYPGNQFGRAEGFRDIIISADGKTQYLIHLLILAADEKNGDIALLTDFRTQFNAGNSGHDYVQKNQIRLFVLSKGDFKIIPLQDL